MNTGQFQMNTKFLHLVGNLVMSVRLPNNISFPVYAINILEIYPIPSVFNAETADYSQSILIKRYRCYPAEYLK